MDKIKKLIFRGPKYIFYFICLIVFYVLGAVAKRCSKKYRNVWIVAERGVDARDNGYHFYKYVRCNHPEINCYYIIDKNSPDCGRVQKYGNVVNYRSIKHHLLFAVSTHKISTHIFGYSPDILCYNRFQKLGLVKGNRVFLQHGIIMNDIEWMFYPRTKLELFVCGAKPEFEQVKARYGFPEGVVRYLGLCRYDALNNPQQPERQILLMPTWRGSFANMSSENRFMKTDYYKNFSELINHPRLTAFLEKEDLKLVFYPHYEAQKFLNTFKSSSNRVILASFEEYDVQQLLMKSMMLITDFSSVVFDFAYMKKPCAYFQFDEEVFRRQNYARGYFDYRRDGFGPVLSTADEVADYIIKLGNNGFTTEKIYGERVSRFFEMGDGKNCERNFEAVKSL